MKAKTKAKVALAFPLGVTDIDAEAQSHRAARATPVSAARKLPYLLTIDEVADVLRTSRKAIYSRIERGLLPGVVRDGRRVLLLRDDLLHWIAERRATSPGGSRR